MKRLQNLHTHSTFCDGTDTPEEIIQTALEKGFESLGFSSHSSISADRQKAYQKEIFRLKEKFETRFPIYCGLEVDLLDEADLNGYDYLIGAAHHLFLNGQRTGVDGSLDRLHRVIHDCFDDDGLAYARAYYRQLSRLPERGDFDIIAHFDLLSKYVERETLFNAECDEYKEYAARAAEALAGKIPYFEVNTGAIARGFRSTPYPAPFLMKELRRLGFRAVISSDCHKREKLDCRFDLALQWLRDSGFTHRYVLTEHGFTPVPLDETP